MNAVSDLAKEYQLISEHKTVFTPAPVELKKGFATFHHSLIVHEPYVNKSILSRRAFVLNVFADRTISSNTDDTLLTVVSPIPKVNKMEGKFFPLRF